MVRAWILVFLFNGQPVASGPHELEVCLEMARVVAMGHCWSPERPADRRRP